MAIYRSVHMSFWTDTKIVDQFTPEDKYFMLYCLTNQYTNLIGCYEISLKQMSNDLGYSKDSVENLLNRFITVHKVLDYDFETKELFIKHWYKYNWTNSPKLDKALLEVIGHVKTLKFKEKLIDVYNSRNTVSIPYPYPIDTSDTDTVTDTVFNNINKIQINDWENKFNKFYSQYPKKVSKQLVRKWFEKNKPNDELFEVMMNSLEAFKKTKDWLKDNGQFIPYPSTWLNQRRWEDEIVVQEKKIVNEPVEYKVLNTDEMTEEEYMKMIRGD